MLFHVGAAQVNISIHTPLAGSDSPSASTAPIRQYFNPHSPCGERLRVCCAQSECRSISIHTPLAGSDRTMTPIRPLARLFQSTLPLRGATPSNAVNNASSDFNPHSPCGERQTDHETDVDEDEFQSTLPLRGATRALSNPLRFRVFQSTLPLRGATYSRTPVQIFLFISIHTPLAGSDIPSDVRAHCML